MRRSGHTSPHTDLRRQYGAVYIVVGARKNEVGVGRTTVRRTRSFRSLS